MSNASAKTFDAVHMVQVLRDDVSSTIAAMSVDEDNRWLQSTEFADPTLRRLMRVASQQGTGADAAPRRG